MIFSKRMKQILLLNRYNRASISDINPFKYGDLKEEETIGTFMCYTSEYVRIVLYVWKSTRGFKTD